jgi:hypothetical protein
MACNGKALLLKMVNITCAQTMVYDARDNIIQ